MALCDFDKSLTCRNCGYVARKPNTHRQCGQSPSTVERVIHYAAAVAEWGLHGIPRRTDEQVAEIVATCHACQLFDSVKEICTHASCGCRVNLDSSALTNKARMSTQHCPIEKW